MDGGALTPPCQSVCPSVRRRPPAAVPEATLNFPSPCSLSLSYAELLDATGDHGLLELDRANETVRLAAGRGAQQVALS